MMRLEGGRAGLGLFDHAAHTVDAALARALDIDHAVIVGLVLRHFLHRDHVAAGLVVGVDHLAEAAASGLDEHVRQENGEGLVAHHLARAPHRVAEAERFLLAGEARLAGREPDLLQEIEGFLLAALAQGMFQLEGHVEMVGDHVLVAPGDEDEMLDPRLARFIDHVLDDRTVDHGQHFLRDRFRGGQETGAETGDGKKRLCEWVRACACPESERW